MRTTTRCLAIGMAVVVVGVAACAVEGAAGAAGTTETAGLQIRWGATWEATEAGNTEAMWRAELAGKAAEEVERIVAWRRGQLAEAMVERFPDRRDRHVEAYRAIAGSAGPVTGARGVIVGLAQNQDLQVRWESIVRGGKLRSAKGFTPAMFNDIVGQALAGGAFYNNDDVHFVSFWKAMDEDLGAKAAPEVIEALRADQDRAARHLAAGAVMAGDETELIRLFRRFPWAAGVHEAMMDLGERALRGDRGGWAASAFREVLSHAGDGALAADAQVGLWLALAGQEDAGGLMEAMAVVANDRPLPWRGRWMPAAAVKVEMLTTVGGRGEGREEGRDSPQRAQRAQRGEGGRGEEKEGGKGGKGVTLGGLRRWAVALPAPWLGGNLAPQTPWPVERIWADGRGIVVAGGGRLARFGRQGGAAVWEQSLGGAWSRDDLAEEGEGEEAQTWERSGRLDRRPVGLEPLVGSVVCVLDRQGSSVSVVGVDVRDGSTLWTTRGVAEWKQVRPIGEPSTARGRAYVLAESTSADDWTLMLACLDTRDGRLVWKRTLGCPVEASAKYKYGGAGVRVYDGALYCTSNSGLIARCDARDGMVDWVTGYAGVGLGPRVRAELLSREGAGPVLVGRTLLAAPRDQSGLVAMDSRTGRVMWTSGPVPSDRIVGVFGGVAVTASRQWVAGVDVATGKCVWCRRMPRSNGSQAVLAGGEVLVPGAGRLARLAAADGRVIEEVESAAAGGMTERVFLTDGTLVELTAPAPWQTGVVAATGLPVQLPLKDIWSVPCRRPVLGLTVEPADADDSFAVVIGRRVVLVRVRPRVEMVWERLLDWEAKEAWLVGGRVVLAGGRTVAALEGAAGATVWMTELPFAVHEVAGDAGLVVVGTGEGSGQQHLGAVDGGTGKVLWWRGLSDGANRPVGWQGMRFRREGAAGRLTVWGAAPVAEAGGAMKPAEVTLDAATGVAGPARRVLGTENSWPSHKGFGARGICYVQGWQPYFEAGGGAPAAWGPNLSGRAPRKTSVDLSTRVEGGVAYVGFAGALFQFDPGGARRETVYELPMAAKTTCDVLDFRQVGGRMVTVSGAKGIYLSKNDRQPPRWETYSTPPPRISVDVFEAGTGLHVERQELMGVACRRAGQDGPEAQVRILPDAILIADGRGVHVFAAEKK